MRNASCVLSALLFVCSAHAQGPGRGFTPPEIRPKNLVANASAVRTCERLTSVTLPNTTIDSAAIDGQDGSCRITARATHPPSGDAVKVFVGIPMKDWNGRFEGTGGGGFSGGRPAGASDTGHPGVMGGLITSTLLTLLVRPTVLLWIERRPLR